MEGMLKAIETVLYHAVEVTVDCTTTFSSVQIVCDGQHWSVTKAFSEEGMLGYLTGLRDALMALPITERLPFFLQVTVCPYTFRLYI